MRGVSADLARELTLDEQLGERLRQLHTVTAPLDDVGTPQGRLAILQNVLAGSEQLLGPGRFQRYRSLLDQRIAGAIFVLPVILAYTVLAWRVFGGKAQELTYD